MMLESAVLHHESVMHRLTHILACVTVVLHVMGGCCWHHAHAACPGDCRESPQAVACRSCDDHGHGDHHACTGEHRHEHDHGCDAAPCVFVVPETGGPLQIAPVQPLAALPAVVHVTCPPTHVAAHPVNSPHFHLSAGLRLHLVNQVLLL
jgi:hypothetical protein